MSQETYGIGREDRKALSGARTGGVQRRTCTVEEAGQALGISRNTAYNLAKAGTLPTLRLGRRVLVPLTALDALLSKPIV
jgi:excisionase family DNA binding protein